MIFLCKMFISTLETTILFTRVCVITLPLFTFPVKVKSESKVRGTKTSDNIHKENHFKDSSSYINLLEHTLNSKHYNEYDYDKLLKEYNDDYTNETYLVTEKKGLFNKHIRKIFFLDGQTKIHSETTDKVGKKKSEVHLETWKYLWRVVKIWFFVYIVIAIPLWCIKGWCCCCLFCHVFKPQGTIDEAKKYLITNPPGVFKLREDIIYYDPTDYEKEAYEKFEHILRTI